MLKRGSLILVSLLALVAGCGEVAPGDDDLAAVILGRPVLMSELAPDAGEQHDTAALRLQELSRLVWDAVHAHAVQDLDLAVTEQEVAEAADRIAAVSRAGRSDMMETLDRMLADPALTDAERASFQELGQALLSNEPDDAGFDMHEHARQRLVQWKLDRQLYDRYGGAVIFQQFHPFEPVGAYRAYLRDCEAEGLFSIEDPGLRRAFWAYYEMEHPMAWDPEDVDFSTPWWMQEAPAERQGTPAEEPVDS